MKSVVTVTETAKSSSALDATSPAAAATTDEGSASSGDHDPDTLSPCLPLVHACKDCWSWNVKDKSHEVRLSGPKNRISHFHPNWSNGTAGVRGTRMLNGGRYYWEINVSQRIFGTR
jgi:SPRY domain-containing SOCS box protein 3